MGGGFFRVAAIMLFIVFWFVEILVSGSTTPTATRTATTTTTKGSFKHLETVERDGPAFHPDLLDSNYMSKRRVPNGPDPIHNRKASKFRQPPGRA